MLVSYFRPFRLQILLACAALITACGSGGGGTETLPPLPPVQVAPAITVQPTTVGVVAGQTATFSVTATGTEPQYQWLRNDVAITGAVQASYSLTTALSDNGAQISVRVSNLAGAITSSAVPLRVTQQFVPVSFTVQPADVTVRAGQNATISAVLGGTGPFSWRWLRNGVDTQLGISNTSVNTPSFVFSPALLSDNGALISLQVTDSSGTITSRQALVTVLP
jgi:hypothetical protein